MNCIKFLIFGKVQKVYYRKYISQALNKEGYIGYIKNLSDGSVEVVVKNYANMDISKILSTLQKGSPKSEVNSIEMGECSEEIIFNQKFEVRY